MRVGQTLLGARGQSILRKGAMSYTPVNAALIAMLVVSSVSAESKNKAIFNRSNVPL